MNVLIDYWNLALSGFSRFIAEYKYIAPVICIMIYTLVHWKQYKQRKLKQFLLYSGVIIVLLMIPVSGMAFLIYQTRFYDYEWIWSCVPLTAILAWGIVTVIFEQIPSVGGTTGKSTKVVGFLAAAAILFMCGNRGVMQQVDTETLQSRQDGREILEYLEKEDILQGHIVWGPAKIMQYMRSHNGRVILFYGRDMWDAKAGAYDYDAYTEEEIACYEWMEIVSSPHNLYLLEVEQAPDDVHEALATENHIRQAVLGDVDVVILPSQINGWMERKIQLVADENAFSVSSKEVGKYTIWRFEVPFK